MKTQLPPYVHSYPAPVVLVGCGSLDKPNIITCSWFGTVCSEPPMVSVSVRRNRHSFHLIRQTGEFSANFPRSKDVKVVDYCGTKSGEKVDKFKELNLTAVPCPPLKTAPMIQECPLTLACQIKQELPLGSHHIFIAEIVSVHCDEELARRDGRADPFPEEQLVYLDKRYWTLKRVT